jgi:hypothetical protein
MRTNQWGTSQESSHTLFNNRSLCQGYIQIYKTIVYRLVQPLYFGKLTSFQLLRIYCHFWSLVWFRVVPESVGAKPTSPPSSTVSEAALSICQRMILQTSNPPSNFLSSTNTNTFIEHSNNLFINSTSTKSNTNKQISWVSYQV